jgi:hypothetical protein
MAKPNSRATLISYCKRELGHPVIEINVDDDQVDDRIDEALQFYQEYHHDAIEKVYLKHKIIGTTLVLSTAVAGNFTDGETITGGTSGATGTVHENSTGSNLIYAGLGDVNVPFVAAETVTGGNSATSATISSITKGDIEDGYVAIPELVTNVVRVFPINDTQTSSINMFDVKYQMHLNDMFSLGYMGSLLEYEMTKQWLSLLDMVISTSDKHIDFARHRNGLRIDMDWKNEVQIDDYLIFECYRILDPDTYTDVYNDYFLKKYSTALIKRQWGQNLIKFEGMTMPGGVTFNGRQFYDDAVADLEKLTEEARLNWEMPVDFMTG